MERSVYSPIVTRKDINLPLYITTIGTTPDEKHIYRPSGIEDILLLYTEEGSGKINLYGKEYETKKNSLVIFPPYAPHDYKKSSPLWKTHWITFSGWAASKMFKSEFNILYLTGEFGFLNKFSEIIRHKNTDNWSNMSSSLLYRLLLEINEYKESDIPSGYKLTDAIKYIEKNFDKEIELSKLSMMSGNISKEHFCRIFKSYTGLRPFEYIRNLKIRRAKELLFENPDTRIKEIGLYSGFQSESYFIKSFKEAVGLTPAEYRKFYLGK